MARDVNTIKNEILTEVANDATLNSDLTSPSSTAIYRLWAFVVAVSINLFEQLQDAFKLELEQIAREAVPGTADWLQKRVLEFQYDALNPQVVTVVDGRATYPTINEALRIIKRAAVKEQTNSRVLVKVAKDDGGGGLTPLDASEINALTGYLDKIGFVGIPIDTSSLFADRVQIIGDIYYSGEFVDTTVKANVITAIKNYLESISLVEFDGVIIREQIIDAIQGVEGVTGVDTQNLLIKPRENTTPIANATNIVRTYETAAGYIVEEDTPGSTFDDTINMVLDV